MGFAILKCLSDSQQILFDNILEDRARAIVKNLVEAHAEMMLSQNSQLSQDVALATSESIFRIVERSVIKKK